MVIAIYGYIAIIVKEYWFTYFAGVEKNQSK